MDLTVNGGFTAQVDAEDFERCSALRWQRLIARRKDGSIRTIYATHNKKKAGKQTTIYLHRFILGITDRKVEVDHRDGDGLNCTRENIRPATRNQNQWNMRMHVSNRSGFKGVYLHKQSGLYQAKIMVDGKCRTLGYGKTPEEAAALYDRAAKEAFGEFANINTP